MKYWTEYLYHYSDIKGTKQKFDNNIYTFDIETTSYLILHNKQIDAMKYQELSEIEKKEVKFRSCMYIWMLSINHNVYYGRTWNELQCFIERIEENVPERKIFFVHNLSFEFQFLKSHFKFCDVMARKSHKVMSAIFEDYNIELRCTYMMTNCKLEKLPEIYNLPIQKLNGNLDYTKVRHYKTELTKEELMYCKNDCLVLYFYILRELETYKTINKIPLTSTGHVRRELKEKISENYSYKNKVKKSINTDPHVFNLLQKAFAGGYTHANWIYTNKIVKNVTSWDFTSSYPYIMVTHKFPSTEFKKCNIKDVNKMSKRFAYLLVVKFTNIKSKYYNNFISASRCNYIKGARYDNGRIISAKEIEITLTDVDFYFILKTHKCEYEIIENYFSLYDYLPIEFIRFVLDKYVLKTQFKNVKGKELEYNLEKAKFNSLYGMSVTNTIRDNVIYDNEKDWYEEKLTNNEIIEELNKEKKKGFLSFSYGVWVTAYARSNLLKNVIKLDEYVVYCDTDSIKLIDGYNIEVIKDYNKFVEKKIKYVSNELNIDISKFAPLDIYNKSHMLGLFENDGNYDEFITQGAKKYAYKKDNKISITVAGVPKSRSKSTKNFE